MRLPCPRIISTYQRDFCPDRATGQAQEGAKEPMKSPAKPRSGSTRPETMAMRIGAATLILSVLIAAWSPRVVAAPEPRQATSPPMREAMGPQSSADEPGETPLPDSGTRRTGIPSPRPITMPGTGIDRSSTDPRRPTMSQLDATDPQRRQARNLALDTIQGEDGPARVAHMAAADVGPRSEEAARVLAEKANLTTLRGLTRNPDHQVRLGLARALVHRPVAGQQILGQLLADKSIKVVNAAVQTVARVGAAPLLGRLAAAVFRYDRSSRTQALVVLAGHGDLPSARSAVIAAAGHPSPSVRIDAVSAIGMARASWARPSLERLERDPAPDVRHSVAKALGRLPPEPSTLRVLGRLAKDRAREVREEAKRVRADLQKAQKEARRARRPRRPR